MFRAFGLDKSLSTNECGDLEEYIRGPLDRMFSHMFSRSTCLTNWGNIFLKRRCLYFFSTSPNIFHVNGQRAYQWGQYILLWNHIYLGLRRGGVEKLASLYCQYLSCNREVSLYHIKVIHLNIITVRGVMGTRITSGKQEDSRVSSLIDPFRNLHKVFCKLQ